MVPARTHCSSFPLTSLASHHRLLCACAPRTPHACILHLVQMPVFPPQPQQVTGLRCPPGTAQPYLSPWVSPSSWRASEWRFLLKPSFAQALFHRVPSCPHPASGVPTLQLWLCFPGISSWAGPVLSAEAVQPTVGNVGRWTVDRGLPVNSTLLVDCPQTPHTHRKRIYSAVPTLSQSVWARGEAGFLC